jgi:hypothetical protein
MPSSDSFKPDEVDHLLRNAQLRDELEPLLDDAITSVNPDYMSTPVENEFLQSMLDWERAPMVPISQWFDPELVLPRPESLQEEQLSQLLENTIELLFSEGIVLDFTNHLSDHQLYTLIYRDILPCYEKRLNRRDTYLHWDCSDGDEDWLRYYASDEDRQSWAEETGEELPPREDPPYDRQLPEHPL